MLLDALLGSLGSFRNRVVVVTGASSGIGRETALLFARLGARVALVARRRALLEAAAADARAARAAVARIRRAWGRIDVLVNNAGVLKLAPVAQIKAGDLDAMLRVNLY